MRTNFDANKSLRPTPLAVVSAVVCCHLFHAFGVAQSAGPPLWNLGIPSFSGRTAAQQAADGPSFQFPSPESSYESGDSSFTLPSPGPDGIATPQENRTEPLDVAPAAYQSEDIFLDLNAPIGSATTTPPGELPLPPPALPADADLALPMVPELPHGGPGVESESASPIGAAIAAGATAETAPLEEETVSWYQIPWRWVKEGWDNHAQLGLDGSNGNSPTVAFQTGLEMKRKTDAYTLGLDFDYRKASSNGVTTEDNGRFNLDYDRLIGESKWSAFGKFGAEWDQFKAFDSRLNLNSGVGYYFVRSDDATLITRFGAGASQEIGAPDDSWKSEAVFGLEAEYQLNRRNKMKGKVDFFPAWEDFSDYRVVSDVAWEILLDDQDNLSLRVALTDRYDSTPQGAKPNDVFYSLLLLVKF